MILFYEMEVNVMQPKYYGGLDTQVNDCWLVILNADSTPHKLIQVPTIKIKGYPDLTVVDVVKVIQTLQFFKPLKLVAEQIDSHGQGNKSAFSFGSAVCLLGAIQEQTDVDLVLKRPAQWKKELKLSSDKDLSRVMAKNIARHIGLEFPYHAFTKNKNGELTLSSNLAESLILAYHSYDTDRKLSKVR